MGGKGGAACLAAPAAATGDVDQEDPPPAAGLQQPPAHEGSDRGGHAAESGPRPDGVRAVAGWRVASMMARLAGIISAPPIPCTARAAMSHPMPGAAAHATEARVNQLSPARNTRRRPQRSLSEPASRISQARA